MFEELGNHQFYHSSGLNRRRLQIHEYIDLDVENIQGLGIQIFDGLKFISSRIQTFTKFDVSQSVCSFET